MMDRSNCPFASGTKMRGPSLVPPTMRHQPVSLEVPVRVQGKSAELSAFFEDTNTVLVFPGGAVLRVAGQLQPGQSILLTNRTTRQQMPCRVAYVKQNGRVRGYAEVEFAQPAPRFWEETAGSVAEHSFGATEMSLSSPSLFAPATPSEIVQVNESFAKVDNIADSIESPLRVDDFLPAPEPTAKPLSRVATIAPRRTLKKTSYAPPAVDEIEKLLAASRVETESQATARAADQFVTHVFNPAGQVAFVRPARSNRRRLFAYAAGVLLLAIGTLGSWGLQAEVAHSAPPAPLPPNPPVWMVARATSPLVSIAEIPLRAYRVRFVFSMMLPESTRRAAELHRAVTESAKAAPLATRRADLGDIAIPEVASQEPTAAAQMTLVSTATPFVPAPAAPTVSKFTPIRLVSTMRPVYPPMARRQRIEGEVVVHAMVDETGKIKDIRVISGPPALREAACEALSQWKYQPAQLNGKPVATHTSVNIKFQL